ncbi:UNVERIFIED_CONTAM: ER lumen protein retaining receptor, putative [Hammondia hammondi]|eukprot:XP_008881802.1 ER lumen protein retaining receptor, putative [Hammondia hammondi]
MQANAYGYSAPPGGMYTGASSGMLGYRGNYAEQVNSGFQQTPPSAYPDQAHGHAGSGVAAAYGRASGSPPGFSGGVESTTTAPAVSSLPGSCGSTFSIKEFSRVVRDREKLALWLATHRGSLQAWTGFFVVVLVVYHLFSDGDFSFLMTLSSLISMFSFLMVVLKIEATKSVAGVSLKMIECYVVLIFARLCSIIPFEGYLPYDRSGDWLYQCVEALSFLLAGTVVYLCRRRYASTYDVGGDTLNHLFLIVPAALLALLFHPSLNAFMPADFAWTFALYLEAVAVLPQLFMFQKQGKVEPFTTHFLAAQALSQVFSFIFWVSSYSELNSAQNTLKSYVGHWVIGMQVMQLIVMGDFIYHYIRCLTSGVPVQFMLSENV